MNTYHIIGVLVKEDGPLFGLPREINKEIDAPNVLAAIEFFEVDGWEWKGGRVHASLISEAMKLERSGQPSLFPLDEVGL